MSAGVTTTFDDKNSDTSTLTNPTLVLNCGSSSIKYALISDDETTRITGLAENLGLDTARIKHTTLNGEKLEISIPGGRHKLALQKILELLEQYHFIAVGHRVVHGGREYSEAVRVDDRSRSGRSKASKSIGTATQPCQCLGYRSGTSYLS